jgi:hypothetical protein
MATNRSRRTRQRQTTTLDPTEIEYLLTGEDPPRDTAGWSLMLSFEFFDGPDPTRRLWLEHRDELKRLWRSQGHQGPSWAEIQFDGGDN